MMKWWSISSLRGRMLLVFFAIVCLIVAVTLVTVQNAAYDHSKGQMLAHTKTSARVVEDKILNRSEQIRAALDTLAKDFSTKRLIAGGHEDQASLQAALGNHRRRLETDRLWVQDGQQKLITASPKLEGLTGQDVEDFASPGIHWLALQDKLYLVNSSPVRFVESSPKVNAWLVSAIQAHRLVTDQLVELTDMQVSILDHQGRIVASSYSEHYQQEFAQASLNIQPGLHRLVLGQQDFVYATAKLGSSHPIILLLTTTADQAFLSYNSLIGQLLLILAPAGLLTLLAAIAISNGISRPLTRLASVANRIRQGQYVDRLPSTGTAEVAALADAIDDMQRGIKQREADIEKLAYYDSLTNLPNRNHFNNHLQKCIEARTPLALFMLDLDRFKDINDTLGHAIGDRVLKLVAERLENLSLASGFLARLGGDEYGLVVPLPEQESIHPIIEQVVKAFRQPLEVDRVVMDMDASIGVAFYPEHGQTPAELIQCADIAMYQSKSGHQAYALYQPELNQFSVERLSLMTELRSAIENQQLQLYFQPKVDLQQQSVIGVEALIRWFHPELGFIPPDEFIPLAEQTGAVRDLTHYAIAEALKYQQQWWDQGHKLNVAVNISALDLVDMHLPEYVSELYKNNALSPEQLTLEVTESSVMNDPDTAIVALQRLRDMGITLSIDDFGTGYSSMAQLKKMPVQELKIDRTFVMDMVTNDEDQVMVKTLISLAQNLGMSTVAEGIEEEQALTLLTNYGCNKAQGYFIGKPMSADDLAEWLAPPCDWLKTP
ncbi:Cyclic di-GMP phosphodiesterase PdeB [Saliniradius amylolyticus]|uniref:Cyclic di-GMP phosphodiesterase PdeB n=1 Tax=Saliniradius amylolyticus TaxID=2183582 RepID=A0A2S2E0R0_9ALTE|nr:EAL domain-containing protein [Saliniradius amylolyticus]AWL11122.1 Cyclic di-GMP phosphodiesterase PdeB [Saliniradius amylolyticus]